MGKSILNILLFLAVVANAQSFEISCERSEFETGEQAHINLIYKGIKNVIWRDNSK